MAEEPPRGSYAIKYVCMYVCTYVASTDMCGEWLSIHTLRNKSDQLCDFYKNVTICRTKRTEDFFNL